MLIGCSTNAVPHDPGYELHVFVFAASLTSAGWYWLFTTSARGSKQDGDRWAVTRHGEVQTTWAWFWASLLPVADVCFLYQNQVDTLNLPFQCRVSVASHREVAVRISGVMRIENLHAVSIKPPTREFGCCPFRGRQGDVGQTFVFLISSSAPV